MENGFDFDVAISFLFQDLGVATELYQRLIESLRVFIYTKEQKELAGTDGTESFRAIFRSRSRLVVILYRDGWGSTPFTRVEYEAITDRFLKDGADFLFFVMLDEKSTPPKWLPDKLIRFNWKDFGMEEAVGAIKARALDRGSVIQRATIADLAIRAEQKATFARERENVLRGDSGARAAIDLFNDLCDRIDARGREIASAAPGLNIQVGTSAGWFVARTESVGVHGSYRNRHANALTEARLTVGEYNGFVIMPGEAIRYFTDPKALNTTTFFPDYSQALGWCWRDEAAQLLSNDQVVDVCFARLLALIDDSNSGKLPKLW